MPDPATSPLEADPLDALLEVRRSAPAMQRFEGGEHLWLGNQGALDATAALGIDPTPFFSLRRANRPESLSYGEIVALSGDFYASPEDLFDAKASRIPWMASGPDLADLREVFRDELQWIEDERRGPGVEYPNESVRLAWNARSYVELALDNNNHFGWHNMLTWARHHQDAISLMLLARAEADPQASDLLFRRAVYTNAFADHFLTDAFAAGHIRVPRAQTRAWASRNGLSEKLAGALSKLVHDQDGHVEHLHARANHPAQPSEGLKVTNARGAVWMTRCDGQLFISRFDDPAIVEPVAAVADSVRELLLAWRDGVVPEGRYLASERAPFPHPDEPRLTEKFPGTISGPRLAALVESVAWYFKIPWISAGLSAEDIVRYFQALPEILEEFRQDVARDTVRHADTVRRLSPAYVEAMKNLG